MMRLMKHAFIIGITLFSMNGYAQQNRIMNMTNHEIAKKFLSGFNNPAQIQESFALLAEDYKFKNPMVELNSKTEFMYSSGTSPKAKGSMLACSEAWSVPIPSL